MMVFPEEIRPEEREREDKCRSPLVWIAYIGKQQKEAITCLM